MSNSIGPNPPSGASAPVPPVAVSSVAQANNARMNKRAVAMAAAALAAGGALAGFAYFKIGGYIDSLAQQKSDAFAKKPASATGARRNVDDELPDFAAAQASAPAEQQKKHKVPDADDSEAIRVAGAGQRSGGGSSQKPKRDPRDAPMLLAPSKGRGAMATAAAPGTTPGVAGDDMAQAREQLRQTREQLNTITSTLQQRMSGTQANAGALMPAAMGSGALPNMPSLTRMPGAAQPQDAGADAAPTERPPLVAGQIANPTLTLAEGDGFTCTLSVEVVSNVRGRMKCVTQTDVRGADQQAVLAEKGSVLTGEYNVTSVRPGTRAIEATWTRLRTPYHVTVPLKWNAVGPLGASGIDGHVNNRWGERITAALLLSLIDDAVKVVIADKQDNSGGGNTNIVLGGTAQTGSRMAEKVLDSTINIPPTISRNHGTVVGVDVMQDVDFSNVYALRPSR